VRDRLAGLRVVPEAGEVTLFEDVLVGDRALHHEHERIELAAIGHVEPLDEVVSALFRAALEVDERPVNGDLGQPGESTQGDLLDARLRRGGERNGVSVATQATLHPQDVNDALFQRLGTCHPGTTPLGARGAHAPCRRLNRPASPYDRPRKKGSEWSEIFYVRAAHSAEFTAGAGG
jgi:hypothetical protein